MYSHRYKKNTPNPFPILLSVLPYLAKHAVKPATEIAHPIYMLEVVSFEVGSGNRMLRNTYLSNYHCRDPSEFVKP